METQKIPITVGCHVVLHLVDRIGKKERLELDVVSDEAADFANGFLGASTPLANVLLGERAGNVIPYLKDDILAIEILSVAISTTKPSEKAQEKRQSRMDKAIREVEHTNAVIFASSFSGKWGDYDPDSLPATESREEDKSEG